MEEGASKRALRKKRGTDGEEVAKLWGSWKPLRRTNGRGGMKKTGEQHDVRDVQRGVSIIGRKSRVSRVNIWMKGKN